MHESLTDLASYYEKQLKHNIIPFWLDHGVDWEYGGFLTFLDRDGSVYNEHKICMWNAGRMVWVFSTLYNEFEQDDRFLEAAENGIGFIDQHGFAPDGTMYYSLIRSGRPLEGTRDLFTELFWILGQGEYARATGTMSRYDQALTHLQEVWKKIEDPATTPSPYFQETLPARMHGPYLITLNVAQSLRRVRWNAVLDDIIAACVTWITEFFLDRDKQIIYEIKQQDDTVMAGELGRWICPGHMIEAGIFLINEGTTSQNDDLVSSGVEIIRWGWDWGWDKELGGLFNDRDIEDKPMGTIVRALCARNKLWWQHTEALHGLLLAYSKSGDETFLNAYWQTHDYCQEHFADPDGAEWFAMLDRQGDPIYTCKGNERKSAFHIVRNFLWNWKLLSR